VTQKYFIDYQITPIRIMTMKMNPFFNELILAAHKFRINKGETDYI